VLVFHPAMAPYRTDLFNVLAGQANLRVVFFRAVPPYDPNLRREDLACELLCDWMVLADRTRYPMQALPFCFGREVATFHPDVVVTHEFGLASSLSTLTRIAGRRVGRIVWSSRSREQFTALSAMRRLAVRTVAPRADALLVYSRAARAGLAEVAAIPESRIFLCANHQNAARLRDFAASTREAVLEACRQRGLAGRPLIVSVGRLVEIKDVATTIRGFAAARQSLRDAVLVIVGDGPLRSSLEGLASGLHVSDSVVFLGHLPIANVQGWLSLSSVNVLASAVEPYGAVVAEGLAHGVPCVCSAVAGAAVLIDSTVRGVLVRPKDVEAMAMALRSRAADLVSADNLATTHRKDLRPLTVNHDAAGFMAAVEHAVTAKR
jgi:glycosyltransferase involved in cell wall biosynthesis